MDEFFRLLNGALAVPDQTARRLLLVTIALKRDPQFAALINNEEYQDLHSAFFNDDALKAVMEAQEGLPQRLIDWRTRRQANAEKLVNLIDSYITKHEIVRVGVNSEHIRRIMSTAP